MDAEYKSSVVSGCQCLSEDKALHGPGMFRYLLGDRGCPMGTSPMNHLTLALIERCQDAECITAYYV